MSDLSIGEVARRAGIRASAIRYYEEAGLLPAPRRSGGQRRYDPGVLDRLALIRFAQRAGFTIAEIRTLVDGFDEGTPMSSRWQQLGRGKAVEIDTLIERVRQMRAMLERALSCGCERLDDCAQKVQTCGLDTTPAR